MSRKICFSSMLQEKKLARKPKLPAALPKLADMVEDFVQSPQQDFTLNFAPLVQSQIKTNFQMGINPLEEWFNNQKANKENISNRGLIINQVKKVPQQEAFPRKYTSNGGGKNHTLPEPQKIVCRGELKGKNKPMKQLLAELMKDKKLSSNQPSKLNWRFSSQFSREEKQQEHYSSNPSKNVQYNPYPSQPQLPRQNSRVEPQLSQEQSNPPKNGFVSSKRARQVELAQQQQQQQQDQQDINELVEQIKASLTQQIECMAERIVKDKQYEEKQQNDVLSRQQEEERARVERAQREIREYLMIKESEKKKKQQEDSASRNQGDSQMVGYSFASDFNSVVREEESKYQRLAPKRDSMCLPNIDEVRSERGDVPQHFVKQSEKYHFQSKFRGEAPSIDKNCIQEIQSVAYQPPKSDNYYSKNKVGSPVEEESVNGSMLQSQSNDRRLKKSPSMAKQVQQTKNHMEWKKVKPSFRKEESQQPQAKDEVIDHPNDVIEAESSIREPNKPQQREIVISKGSAEGRRYSQEDEDRKKLKLTLSPNFQHEQLKRSSAPPERNPVEVVGRSGGGKFEFELDF